MEEDAVLIPQAAEEKLERCVLCGGLTEIPVALPVNQRIGYVEGSGQPCASCRKVVYCAGK